MKIVFAFVFYFILLSALFLLFGCTVSGGTDSNSTIKIGAVLPITGLSSMNGQLAKNGLLLAQQEINDSEGLGGRRVEIFVEDNKSEPKEAATSYKFLRNYYNVSMVLTIGSASAMILSPSANNDKVVLFSNASTPSYTSKNDFTYRIIPSADKDGAGVAKLAYYDLNIKELAVIYANDDYGKGVMNSFVNNYESFGGKILIQEFFETTTTDFRANLLKIREKKPKVLFIAALGRAAGLLAKQARQAGLEDVQFLCGPGCLGPDLINQGKESVEGLIFPYTYMDTNSRFFEKYYQFYGSEPNQLSERMYDIAKLYFEVVKICGGEKDKDCLLRELQKIEYEGSSSTKIKFDENGDVIEDYVLFIIKNGKFELYNK